MAVEVMSDEPAEVVRHAGRDHPEVPRAEAPLVAGSA
jgi:hypothetical protein